MVCFLACFTTSNRPKHQHSDNATHSKYQALKTTESPQLIEPPKQEQAGQLTEFIRESKDEVEEEVNCCSKKRVTFDLNVKACVAPSTKESSCDLVETNEEKKSGNEEKNQKIKEMKPILDTIVRSYVPNNRYQNCRKSTDECEDIGGEDSNVEEDEDSEADDKGLVLQEESSESLFSLSIDSRKQVCDVEKGEKEVSSPMPVPSLSEEKVKAIGSSQNGVKRSRFGHSSVLSPIENFTQWEVFKEERPLPISHPQLVKHHQEKENSISLEPSFKVERHNSKPKFSEVKAAEQEVGVDTSLSSWLVGSEATPKSNGSIGHSSEDSESEKENSSSSIKQRRVLGELSEFSSSISSSSSSSRGLRSKSSEATPEIGTVGSYWIHTGQSMDSSSSCKGTKSVTTEKDQIVNYKSTPFEAKLDTALDVAVC
ncbi:hypothetical protein F8388_012657 [Cannabis sativa]|uniref:Uncharacterized protein n=1 Tax=Cannabis sativa TaxID=3483 RepID=A0A7J6HB98_CANSA|nr:hypothetical protein G4B88_012785 [Cannabis sativa]KAF4392201.1 hypothetical protein F8388_012657 [Cannabis sativa]